MRILWDNEVDKYTPLFTSERGNFPGLSVQDIRLAVPWRTVSDTGESVIIDAGVGETITASCAAIAAHNLTAGATIKIQANNTSSWIGPPVDESFAHSSEIMTHFFGSAAYRFWRFYFDDGSNPDTYIEIGRLFLGTYLQMPPVEPGVEIPRATTSVSTHSITGQTYGDKGVQYRIPAFSFPLIIEAERGAIDSMWAAVDNVKPVFLLIWEDSLNVVAAMYAKIDQENISWRKLEALTWTVNIAFREEF